MENQNNKKKDIREGSVGVCIDERQNRETGQTFFTFEPVRCYRRDGNENFEYCHSFTEKNDEALGVVISKALSYGDTTGIDKCLTDCPAVDPAFYCH